MKIYIFLIKLVTLVVIMFLIPGTVRSVLANERSWEITLTIYQPVKVIGIKWSDDRAALFFVETTSKICNSSQEIVAEYYEAAKQGSCNAQNGLGVLYGGGLGVPIDYAQAEAWFLKSAKNGCANAKYNLGMMYFIGLGVPIDYAQAEAWFNSYDPNYEKIGTIGISKINIHYMNHVILCYNEIN